jgi:uncharacterized protein YjbJ (UPF0337 family)
VKCFNRERGCSLNINRGFAPQQGLIPNMLRTSQSEAAKKFGCARLSATDTETAVCQSNKLKETLLRKAKMNEDRIGGNWKQFKGKVKEKWGDLTDDDMTVVEGKRDQLVGKIQERYGYEKDRAEKEVKDWEDSNKYHW